MIIHVKNKNTLIIDDFSLKCCVGKNGFILHKKEGDYSTPKGLFNLKKLYRKDNKYDYLITINHNDKKVPYKGSAIFLHLTDNYKPTAGCIALKKKDFEILLKLIDQKTKIKIG